MSSTTEEAETKHSNSRTSSTSSSRRSSSVPLILNPANFSPDAALLYPSIKACRGKEPAQVWFDRFVESVKKAEKDAAPRGFPDAVDWSTTAMMNANQCRRQQKKRKRSTATAAPAAPAAAGGAPLFP
mmetsp:Transcript_20560/g.34409  ORF Transcript_20560/g.34409 Transcript_20560/m.34409 type:complete len:128 (+) Transcript_20560:217-600(+)